jgi:hypothetical protein
LSPSPLRSKGAEDCVCAAAARDLLPDYGNRRRHGEAISSSIAKSTVKKVIYRRFAKKQQMRWQPETAHLLRTRTLNGRLGETFQRGGRQ